MFSHFPADYFGWKGSVSLGSTNVSVFSLKSLFREKLRFMVHNLCTFPNTASIKPDTWEPILFFGRLSHFRKLSEMKVASDTESINAVNVLSLRLIVTTTVPKSMLCFAVVLFVRFALFS